MPSGRTFRKGVTCAEIVADFLTSAVGIAAAYYVYVSLPFGRSIHNTTSSVVIFSLIGGVLIPLLLERNGAYRGGSSLLRIRETERALRIPWQVFLFLLPATYFTGGAALRGPLIFILIAIPALLLLQKHLAFSVIRYLHRKGFGVRRVIIYGAGDTGRRVLSALLESPRLGLLPVAIVDDDPELEGSKLFELSYRRHRYVEIKRGPISPELVSAFRCEMLIIAIPTLSREKFPQTLQAARDAGIEVSFLPNRAISENQWVESIDIDGLLLSVVGSPTSNWRYEAAKRVFDVVGAIVLLIVLSPLLLTVALLVRLDSPGPVLFKQMRVGKREKLFSMYKFRSMHVNAPAYGVSPVDAKDARITRIGRFLRKTSFDEVPQLLNVLEGTMSLVGPRPEMPFIVEGYGPKQRQRLQVMPGITGMWQLSADRAFHIHESIEYDLYYVRNRNFFLDLAVVVHTAIFAMRGV